MTTITYRVAFPGQTGTECRTAQEVAREWQRLCQSQRSDYWPVIMGSNGREYDLDIDDSTDKGRDILVPMDD